MQKFTVRVRTEFQFIQYPAIALSAIDAFITAVEKHGLCGVTVHPR